MVQAESRSAIKAVFAMRAVRMLANGALATVLGLYLASRGLRETQIGLLITAALLGDALLSLGLSLVADRLGRRRVLTLGALLMAGAAAALLFVDSFGALVVLATVAIFSPNGREVGPFLAVEHAALAEEVEGHDRTKALAWYNLAGLFCGGIGALLAGGSAVAARSAGLPEAEGYRWVILGNGAFGLALALLASRLPTSVETARARAAPGLGLHRSKGIVARLSALFVLDSFAGGFVLHSLLALWLQRKFGLAPEAIGGYFFAAEMLAGLSGLVAARIAKRFGLVNTMVFTHLPANGLLILAAFAPTSGAALLFLLLRASVSSMDIPTRHAYVLAVVAPDERSAAGGVTNIARSVGASLSPSLAGAMMGSAGLLSLPLIVAGGLKIVYDLALLGSFRGLKPEHESGVDP